MAIIGVPKNVFIFHVFQLTNGTKISLTNTVKKYTEKMNSNLKKNLRDCERNGTNRKIGICAHNLLFNKTLGTTDAAKRFNQSSKSSDSKHSRSSINESFKALLHTQQFKRIHAQKPSAYRSHSHINQGPPVREVICYHSQKETPSSRPARRSSTNSDKLRPFLKRGSLVYLNGGLSDEETCSEYTVEEGPHLLDGISNEESQVWNCLEATGVFTSARMPLYFHKDHYRRYSSKFTSNPNNRQQAVSSSESVFSTSDDESFFR